MTAGPARILVVDDDPHVRDILREYLSTSSRQCVTASRAAEALDDLNGQEFSLVLTDMLMPGMSGLDLLPALRKHDPDLPVIMITGIADVSTAVDALRLGACDYITKPFNLPVVRSAVERALERRHLLIENRNHRRELERKVRERTLELDRTLSELEESYRITLEALVTALDAREHETQAHSQRVREYTCELARQLGVGPHELVHIGRGALLHDVGKIGVPDSILLKPGSLSAREWVEMRKHPQIGYDILKTIRFLEPAVEIVLTHQERWDGKGYPAGLRGEEIPLGSRIFAVVDTFDAMTSNRPYRQATTYRSALEEIRRCSGTQFDPRVIEAFLSIPAETWSAIHDAASNLTHHCYAAICPT